MKDLLSVIINLRALDMSNINSKGYCLDLYGKKILIVHTPKKWIITIVANNQIKHVYRFIFDVYDSIQLNDGTIFINVEEFISSIMESIHN